MGGYAGQIGLDGEEGGSTCGHGGQPHAQAGAVLHHVVVAGVAQRVQEERDDLEQGRERGSGPGGERGEGESQGKERHPKVTFESPAPPLFAWINPNAYNAPDSENGEEDWPPWGR